MHQFWHTFWIYLTWSLDFLCLPGFRFATLALVFSLVASAIWQRPFFTVAWRRTFWMVIVQVGIFVLTIAIAVSRAAPVRGVVSQLQPNYWALRAVDLLEIGSLVVGVSWIVRMRGLRWFALSLVLLQFMFLYGAGFIAAMALTGDWL
jgi:hypothetical protein